MNACIVQGFCKNAPEYLWTIHQRHSSFSYIIRSGRSVCIKCLGSTKCLLAQGRCKLTSAKGLPTKKCYIYYKLTETQCYYEGGGLFSLIKNYWNKCYSHILNVVFLAKLHFLKIFMCIDCRIQITRI